MRFCLRKAGRALLLLLLLSAGANRLAAQAPLFLVDENTTVHGLAFRFDSTRTFEESLLKEQIATTAPGFIDRVKRILPFLQPAPYPFSPLELQRDVVRLRRFYEDNGFLQARVGYAPSRLDTSNNRIKVIFTIHEGPPLLIRSVNLYGADTTETFDVQDARWRNLEKAIAVKEGDRYSTFERLRTSDQAVAWFKNRGYAFARVGDTLRVDSTANLVDLNFFIDPGPLAYFDEITIEGNESVERSVIARELPFRQGQRFSDARLTRGQRELFALNLFRTALTELPEQPRDSTATVLVRVREARPQFVTYQAGYGRQTGVTLQGDWTHRNFFGAARTLTVSLAANTGYGAAPGGDRPPSRLFRTSVALRQPYLFTTRLSATVAPFIQFERDPQLLESDKPLGINSREFGLNSALLYEVYPFRIVSLQHSFSRALLYTSVRSDTIRARDVFSKSILTLSGTLGRTNDYINPSKGFLVRPSLELAGRVLKSGVQYYKTGLEATG